MTVKLKNNASGTLATAVSASDTGVSLTTGNGANFPTLTAPDYFYATLASSGGTTEVVKVTARSGDSLTVVRAQESTTAQSFAAGSRIEMRVTAQSVLDAINGALNYLGPYAIDPTLRNDGSALQAGDLYFNTTVSELRVYNGSAWQSIVLGGTTVQRFSGNGSTTAFVLSTVPATENTISVYIQGVYQQKDTYSVAGSTLNFSEAPVSGTDNIEVVTIQNIAIGTTSAAMVSITDSGGFYSGTDVEAALQQVIQFVPAGTGAVATTVQTKLRESVSVKDFGAVGNGVTDDTAAFVAAFAASNKVYAPAPSVSYRLSSVTIANGKQLITDGFATVLHQTTGTAVGTRMIVVAGSNVSIGSMTVKGNIATDTDEQNHSIFVQSNATVGNLSNITIGDIYGQDVRGDLLYLGATTGYLTTYVSFGRIVGSNILRNVVSIVGAAYVNGDAAISSGATGLWALDIEPNTVTCHDIHVEMVRGAAMGCVPPLVANAAYNISIGIADLDPSFAPDSTPAYASRNVQSALTLRNIKSFKIDYLKAKDHTHFALNYIWNSGEQRGEGIEIGYLDSNNVGSGDVTYNTAILANGINSITIRDARVVLNAPATDCMIEGSSSGSVFTRAIIDRAVVDGRVARYIQQGRFSNILVNTTAATSTFSRIDDCTILDSDITHPTLINFSNRCTFINVKATCSTAYYGSTVADMTRINCNWGGVITGLVTQRAAAASLTGEIAYGSTTATTVGAAGAASALPANPTGYIIVNIAGTDRKIPFYAN